MQVVTWRVARGYASGDLTVNADNFARAEDSGDGRIGIVIANASRSPFEAVAPLLSRRLIEAAFAAWRGGFSAAESIEAAMTAFSKVNAESPTGWMLVARLDEERRGEEIEVAWVGREEAWIIDDGVIDVRTDPHSLYDPDGKLGLQIATRSLVPNEVVEPDIENWGRGSSGRLVCMTASVARLDESEAITLATGGDLDTCARALAEAAARARPRHPAAVVLVEWVV
jgi:hypothetical protein